MKNTGRYEGAVLKLLPSSPKNWAEGHTDLLSAACEIDRLTDRIVQDSKSMARKFESYAAEITARSEGWDPTGYSTIRDISTNTAKLESERRNFNMLLRLLFGRDAVKKLNVEIAEESRAA